jgi:hypothetical protein
MTNPVLEFLRENKRRYRDHQHELCEPIRKLVRDYAMMRDAVNGALVAYDRLIEQGEEALDEDDPRLELAAFMGLLQGAFNTAETHRELLDAVREGM